MQVLIANIFFIVGACFIFLGLLGIFRMPDIFNKIQAGTKATTLGFLSIVLGAMILMPHYAIKILLLGVFIALTNPIGSHNLARAAYRNNEKIILTGVDKLKEDNE